jgi:hypothetical protein
MKSFKRWVLVFVAITIAVIVVSRTRQSTEPQSQVETLAVRIGPPDIYPDSIRTPGVVDPDITQDNIQENICNSGWSTKSIRPRASYTSRLKLEQIQQYGYSDTDPADYEEDHLIPLEIGGNPSDPKNLWPEPYYPSIPDGGARAKDQVENYLHKQVCAGNLTLEEAQKEVAADWYRIYVTFVRRDF